MPPLGFEPAIPGCQGPQTQASDRAVTEIGSSCNTDTYFSFFIYFLVSIHLTFVPFFLGCFTPYFSPGLFLLGFRIRPCMTLVYIYNKGQCFFNFVELTQFKIL